MKPERWQQLDELFHFALDHEANQRGAFLDKECAGNAGLRREVEALLAAHEEAGSFIERPAIEVEAQSVANDQNQLAAGQKIGHYRIVSQLGTGGMGEVYLAEDARLDRKVALKLLPIEFTHDRDRMRRFQQEARAASALNHPNIVTIHEIGQVDNRHFIATEFIDGETLRVHITKGKSPITGEGNGNSESPLLLREILNIAIQTADALASAHETGVVHRDIKPENIMIRRRDGYVKVLDFGLAKLSESVGVADTEAPTKAQVKTSPGLLMGTVTYMSPEQTRGEKVDARTDIWSLGVVLYELVAGCAPFEKPTPSEVIALILEREPAPLTRYVRDVPVELERIVTKALTKDREQRYQIAKDLLVDLRHLQQRLEIEAERDRSAKHESAQPGATLTIEQSTTRKTSNAEYLLRELKKHKLSVVITLAVMIFAANSVALWLMRQSQPLATPALTQLTRDTGLTTDPALSPDGKMLAYASDRGGKGNLDIWVRQIGGGEPIRLTQDPADEREPTFSPDGTMIAFQSQREGGGIYVVSAMGGSPPRKIASDGQRPRFSPDGSQIAYWAAPLGANPSLIARDVCRIFVVASAGGIPRQVRPDFLAAVYPEWAPDGKHLLFLGNRDAKLPLNESLDWWVTPLDQGPPISTGALRITRKEGLTGGLPAYPWALITPVWEIRTHSLIFSAHSGDSTNLWRIAISPDTWSVRGPPQRLTHHPTSEESPSVVSSADGSTTIAFASLSENTDIWSLPLDAKTGKVTGEPRPIQLTRDSTADLDPSLSPDGRKMLFTSARSGNKQIWIKDLETGEDAPLTAGRIDNVAARFSPDGAKVSFIAHHENKFDIFIMPAAGGPAEMICEDCGVAKNWSLDGKYLFANHVDGRLILVEIASHRRIDFLGLSNRWFWACQFSPDGRWITFGEESNPELVHIAPFQGETPAVESAWTSALCCLSQWSPDGSMVYGTSGQDGFSCIWAQRLDLATKRPIGSPIPIYHAHGARLTVLNEAFIGRESMVFEMTEHTGNIWMAQWKGGW